MLPKEPAPGKVSTMAKVKATLIPHATTGNCSDEMLINYNYPWMLVRSEWYLYRMKNCVTCVGRWGWKATDFGEGVRLVACVYLQHGSRVEWGSHLAMMATTPWSQVRNFSYLNTICCILGSKVGIYFLYTENISTVIMSHPYSWQLSCWTKIYDGIIV